MRCLGFNTVGRIISQQADFFGLPKNQRHFTLVRTQNTGSFRGVWGAFFQKAPQNIPNAR